MLEKFKEMRVIHWDINPVRGSFNQSISVNVMTDTPQGAPANFMLPVLVLDYRIRLADGENILLSYISELKYAVYLADRSNEDEVINRIILDSYQRCSMEFEKRKMGTVAEIFILKPISGIESLRKSISNLLFPPKL
jgi:hypothetical protein